MSYRWATTWLILIQVLFFSPHLLQGYVIYPHSNDYEAIGISSIDTTYLTNRRFSDQSSVYIPEIHHHLNSKHRHWLASWIPQTQLGRPASHLTAFSKAYIPTHLLALISNNAFRVYTLLTVGTLMLTGIFFFLFLRSLSLLPIACLIAAAGLSMGIYVSYWSTFIMFTSTLCWSVCLLWLITDFIKNQSFVYAIGISFASYNLFMSGYPQYIVMYFYIILGYSLIYLFEQIQSNKQKIKIALVATLGGAIGLLMALPAYADIFVKANLSTRLSSGDEFFLALLPNLTNLKNWAIFLVTIVDPFWQGSPIRVENPFPQIDGGGQYYNGLSLSIFYFLLLIVSFAFELRKKLWYWYTLIAIFFTWTVFPPAYLFAVHYLGFGISRFPTLIGALVPTFTIAAYTVDSIQRKHALIQKKHLFICLLVGLLLSLCYLLNWKFQNIQIGYAIASWLIILGFIFYLRSRQIFILIFLTVVTVLIYGRSMVFARPLDSIATSSPLIEFIQTVQKQTGDNSRYALYSNKMLGILSANQEIFFELQTIHSYDSLSSKKFQEITKRWSDVGTFAYGRYFLYLDNLENIKRPEFRLTGVNLLLSKSNLSSSGFTKIQEINGIKLYRLQAEPIPLLQTQNYTPTATKQFQIDPPFQQNGQLSAQITKKMDDYLEIQVTPTQQQTLLFISQQYHPQWQARSPLGKLNTVTVNQFYLGILVPAHVSQIVLEFTPYVLWSWVPQAIYGLLSVFLTGKYFWQRSQI